MAKMQVEWVPIKDVHPYENNPRNNDDAVESVAASIEEFGWQQPIVVDKDGVIIAGHTRLKAAQRLMVDTVPVVKADDLTEEQVAAYRLADNKVSELAGWDFGKLEEELNEITDIDMSMFGFDMSDFDSDDIHINEDDFDENDAHDDVTVVERGEVWVLGDHRLMCGDSTNGDDVAVLMEAMGDGVVADELLTDPPYNVSYEGKTPEGLTIQNDQFPDEEKFVAFLCDAMSCATEHLKAGGAFYVWHSDSHRPSFVYACEQADLSVREIIIWNKNVFVMGRQDYQWKHEPCLYGWKNGASHYWCGRRDLSTVWDFNKPMRNGLHPTMKPVALFAECVRNNTHKGDVVLDPFAGSGTSIIACEQLERRCASMELDEHYCGVIIDRWETMTGKKAHKAHRAGASDSE